MTMFCDMCGDITIAYIPVEVRFFNKSKLSLNFCLECWTSFEASSRKVKVAKMLGVLRG